MRTVYASRQPCYICGRCNQQHLTVSNWNGSKFVSCSECCTRFPIALCTPAPSELAPMLPPEPTTDPGARWTPDDLDYPNFKIEMP